MANADKKQNLMYLGDNFQKRLVKCFIEDQTFFTKLFPIIDQNLFTIDPIIQIVGILRNFYSNKEVVPTYDDVFICLNKDITNEIRLKECTEILTEIRDMPFGSIDLVEDEAERFFKQQSLMKAIGQVNNMLRKGSIKDYYVVEDVIKKAIELNNKEDIGYCLFENIENDLREDYRQTITTGCKELDESLYGGLGKGELGIIIAPLGTGKTSLSTGFAAAAATAKTKINNNKGYKVLHLFFEDEEVNINRKYYGYLTDFDACELSKPEIRPKVVEILKSDNEKVKMLKENIRALRLSSGEVTASDIKSIIKRHISHGFKPDLVVVDYFECLKPERIDNSMGDSEWSKEGVTMRKLESLCNEFKIGLWVPVQSTKGAIGSEIVGLAHAGGSVKKTQIGHVIISLAQTDEQKERGRLSLFIGKLRAAKLGRMSYKDVLFNNGTCKFDMSDLDMADEVIDGNSTSTTMQNIAKSVKQEYRKNNNSK